MNNPFQNYPLLIQNPIMIQQPQIPYQNYPIWPHQVQQIPPTYQYYQTNFIRNAPPNTYIEQPQFALVNGIVNNTNNINANINEQQAQSTYQQVVYGNNNINMINTNHNNSIDITGNGSVNNNMNQQMMMYGMCHSHQGDVVNNNSNNNANDANMNCSNDNKVHMQEFKGIASNGDISLINKINNFNDKNTLPICNSNNNKNEISHHDTIPQQLHTQDIIHTQIQTQNNTVDNNNNSNSNNNNTKIKYYRCTFKDCDKVFPKECNLKDHIRTHTGEKPYKCSFLGCEKSFSQHGNLKKHEKVHVGDKKYFCDYPGCGKKFSASYNLKIHYRCHTNEKPYKCSFANCERSFYDKGNLKYHEKTQHMAESLEFPYSCEHMGCNAKFRTQKEKLNHHNQMEPECLIERQELIKLIQRYKILLKHIVKENNIDPNENEIILNLKNIYEETQGKLIDIEYFKSFLGETFESECINVEEIADEKDTTDQCSSKND